MSQTAKRFEKKTPNESAKTSTRLIRKAPEKTSFELTQIQPLTDRQSDMFDAFDDGNHIIGYGSSGTGKSLVAVYLALREIFHKKSKQKIVILRSPLSVNHQGYLPGTLEEKEAVYERPYEDIVNWLMNNSEAYLKLKEAGTIKFMSTSYIRGLTWDDCIVIADETQNMLWEEINTIATRVGEDTRLIFLGDLKQNDLSIAKRNQTSGMQKLLLMGKFLPNVEMINFLPEDIVRGEFVKQWILACEAVDETIK